MSWCGRRRSIRPMAVRDTAILRGNGQSVMRGPARHSPISPSGRSGYDPRQEQTEAQSEETAMINRRTFAALLAGTVAAPKRAWSEPVTAKTVFYTSVGPELTLFDIDIADAALQQAQHGDASRQHPICLAASVETISLCRVEQWRAGARRRQASGQRIPHRSRVGRLAAARRAASVAVTPHPYQRRQIRRVSPHRLQRSEQRDGASHQAATAPSATP